MSIRVYLVDTVRCDFLFKEDKMQCNRKTKLKTKPVAKQDLVSRLLIESFPSVSAT